MVSAWSTENGLTLGQVATEEKSNEITAIPELIDQLDVKNAIVTIDAMGCQKKIAKKIVDRQADYVRVISVGACYRSLRCGGALDRRRTHEVKDGKPRKRTPPRERQVYSNGAEIDRGR